MLAKKSVQDNQMIVKGTKRRKLSLFRFHVHAGSDKKMDKMDFEYKQYKIASDFFAVSTALR